MWHVVVSAMIAGAAMSVGQTSGQAIIPSLVPREGLMNAVSLSSVVMGSSRVIGPSIAGFLIQAFGVQGAYFAMAGFLVLPVFMPLLMWPLKITTEERRESVFRAFGEGLRYSLRTPEVRIILIVGVTVITLAIPVYPTLAGVCARSPRYGAGRFGAYHVVFGRADDRRRPFRRFTRRLPL